MDIDEIRQELAEAIVERQMAEINLSRANRVIEALTEELEDIEGYEEAKKEMKEKIQNWSDDFTNKWNDLIGK